MSSQNCPGQLSAAGHQGGVCVQAADRPGVQEVKQATCSGTSAVAIARPQCLNGREIAARRETMTDGCHRTKAAILRVCARGGIAGAGWACCATRAQARR